LASLEFLSLLLLSPVLLYSALLCPFLEYHPRTGIDVLDPLLKKKKKKKKKRLAGWLLLFLLLLSPGMTPTTVRRLLLIAVGQ
jgi:hypothetical protein